MKINLQLKIIRIVFLLSFFLFSILIYTNINKYNQLLENTYTNEANAIANALNASIGQKSDLEKKELLQANIYKHIWLNPNIIEISINTPKDDGMTVLFSSEQNKINTFPDPENLTSLKKDILIDKIIKKDDKRLLRVITPIHLSGQILGTFQIDLTLENVDKTKKDALVTILLFYALIIAGFTILIFFLSKTITKPIEELTSTVKSIAAGDLNKRAKTGADDEVGQLAISFNKMIDNLLAAEREKIKAEKIKRRETEKYARELENLNRLKDDFLNVTAHELRTPLFPIKAQTELLLKGEYGGVNKEQAESLEMIKRNEKRLHKLIVDVLDISKIKSQKLKVIPEKINLEKIIRDAAADLKEESRLKNISIEIKEPLKLPEISADPERISQVLGNLINNSIKFTNDGGKITIEAEESKNNVVVKISDNGIGLSQENIKKLFVPFSQIETGLIRERKGTGLGLAISRGIIKAHKGEIWVESAGEGKGSTFIFTLPIKIEEKENDILIA